MLRKFTNIIFSALAIAASAAAFQPVFAAAPTETNANQGTNFVEHESQLPLHVWQNKGVNSVGIVLAIHGLTMHGSVFAATAKYLSDKGYIVAAPDLRGYGDYYQSNSRCKTDYEMSDVDLAETAERLREQHPGLQLYIAGESLGGTAAIRLAAHHAELVDGLILSAPALRYRRHFGMRAFAQVAMLATNPARRIDTTPYIHYFSNDARIQQEERTDPLRRKRMGIGELISSCRYMSGAVDCISEVPDSMPVLVMQGDEDRMVKRESVSLLEKRLKSTNCTVRWIPQHGHILLETEHVDPATLDTVTGWLEEIGAQKTVAAAL